MKKADILPNLNSFLSSLENSELSPRSLKSYQIDLSQFLLFLPESTDILKSHVIEYKRLISGRLKPATVNRKLIIINRFLNFCSLGDYKVRLLKVQQNNTLDNIMSTSDYERLLRWAKKLDFQMFYVIKTFALTGLRVSELEVLTAEALRAKKITFKSKGKIRTVPICPQLVKLLKSYCQQNNITGGPIFLNRNHTPLSPNSIFKKLKYIAGQGRIKLSKVHPHVLRHLFAKEFLKYGSPLELADILGHSSLNTTRIYCTTSTREKALTMDKINL